MRLARRVLGCTLACGLAIGPARAAWHNTDVDGYAPSLAFAMTDASTGNPVTQAHFRGRIVLLYLGYTQCPDVCPLTLAHAAEVLRRLGVEAGDVRFLFVTVDPGRDTLPILKAYTAAFGPDFIGLRGDANAIARLARRFRLAYSVTPASDSSTYEVTHSAAIYVFGRDGRARLLLGTLATSHPDIAGTAADLRRLIRAPSS